MHATGRDDPVTLNEEKVSLSRPSLSQPVLIIVAWANKEGGHVQGERLIPFEHAIEIGRQPQAPTGVQTCALRDLRVSARHARITRTRLDGFEIVDLGSKNGTLVEGRRITGPTRVRDGALLFMGGHALMVRVLSEAALTAIREDLQQPFGPVPTLSASMAKEVRRLRRLAGSGEEILLSGETGVGKEVYAKAVHQASGRPGRFVALNCAALPTDLVESELFGFVRGAHSQAAASKPGIIEEAEHGTLFLDEIGDMPVEAQAKLLRFLQEHTYVPLGGREMRAIDVHIIGATSSLAPSAHAPGLRRDLLARLGADPVVLPPLRDRREDIGTLAHYFLDPGHSLSKGALLALCLYSWPHNVRELEKVMREAALCAEEDSEIRLTDLPRGMTAQLTLDDEPSAPRRRSPRPRLDKAEIEALLERHKGNVAEVARELDRQWAVVWRWIQQNDLDVEKYRG